MKREGILFVISAPSGAGKTSLCKEIVDFFPMLGHSVSYTTRPMREGERDGVDYHFVSSETFAGMIEEGAFAEWAEVHGNRYGTALATLDEARRDGQDILLDIDCQGASQLKKTTPGGVFIFLLPPSYEELRRRLTGRNTDAPEVIARRIANARGEVSQAFWYDYLIVNDDFETALNQFKAVIQAENCRTARALPAIASRFEL
ncbi:MAG TPA: guanylate kinase [Desulfuromonadales bacterium]|nr:guanylate kinase [Desulfuromonadales bacterium]